MQLLAKFKKILYMGFRATLNFRKFKVALNPMYRTNQCLHRTLAYLHSSIPSFSNREFLLITFESFSRLIGET